jgi:ubiquinone/menaquinone biosynthesis C-methylase UbiE
MTVLEPGPGMGFFTLELARMVGPRGRVVVVDIQQKMLDTLAGRAKRAGVQDRIEARLVSGGGMGADDLAGKVDFILAFYMVHELPDREGFLAESRRALKPGGKMLLSEPVGHVTEKDFQETLDLALKAGFTIDSRPVIRRSRSAVLAI